MSTFVKIASVAGIAGLILWASKRAMNAAKDFTLRLVGYGLPKRSGYKITIPVIIEFKSRIPVNLDNLLVDLYIYKNSVWQAVARINQPISLSQGTTRQTVNAVVDLQAIFTGSFLDALAEILRSGQLHIKADVTATFKGVTLPKQTIQDVVKIV